MKTVALLCCLFALSCHLPDPRIKGVPDPGFAARQRAAARDVAFTHDSLVIMRFDPPMIYASLKYAMERCSGKTKAGWPRFYLANVNPLPPNWQAYYSSERQSIVLAFGNEAEPSIVMHELLHWLLDPVNAHPAEYFGAESRCGQVLVATQR